VGGEDLAVWSTTAHDRSAVDSKPNTDPVHAISSHFLADFSARRVFNCELMMTDSQQLLADYAKNGSETAFRELVTHYIDLVFSTALRLVDGDAHRAEDVVQTVFMDLARQAYKLSRGTMLGGWLHRDTCFVAAKIMRGERRRQFRESQAAEMNALNATETRFADIAPVLDEAINELGDEDRRAILLRFYEQYDLRSVGEALGSSENAAQKRVTRALDQLHSMLTRRGIALSAAGLGTALAGEAVTAAPAALAASVAGSALAGVAAATGVGFGAFKIMTITKLKLSVLSAIVIGGLATSLVVQHQALVRLRDDTKSLQQQIVELRGAQEQLAQAQVDKNEVDKLRRDQSELLRLRGEVTTLRKASQTPALQPVQVGQDKPDAKAAPETALGVTRLQASIHAQVGTGQTLLTGGWASEPGKRIFVLATPHIEGENKDQVVIRTKVIEVPESALAKVGLDAFKTEGNESSLQQVLAAEQTDMVLKQLEGTEGADLLAQSSISTTDGRQAQIQTVDEQVVEGVKQTLGPVIDIVPVISSDKSTIDITLKAGINRRTPKTQ
jgi:RNA polymerase sigma factor (sigma-70 family)